MTGIIVKCISLFFAGLLAGAEFLVCYGLRGPLNMLEDHPQIGFRQALIRRLRVVVPSLFLPTVALSIAACAMDRAEPSFALRCVALLALAIWSTATFLGTVPINKDALEWKPEAPPGHWRSSIRRWEALDLARCWAAVAAFGALVPAYAAGMSGG
jgi:anthrone oxygenase-like protein